MLQRDKPQLSKRAAMKHFRLVRAQVLFVFKWPLEGFSAANTFLDAAHADLRGLLNGTGYDECGTMDLVWSAAYFTNTNIYVPRERFTMDSVKASLWFPTLNPTIANQRLLKDGLRKALALAAGVELDRVQV
jgi:hypothetical protein